MSQNQNDNAPTVARPKFVRKSKRGNTRKIIPMNALKAQSFFTSAGPTPPPTDRKESSDANMTAVAAPDSIDLTVSDPSPVCAKCEGRGVVCSCGGAIRRSRCKFLFLLGTIVMCCVAMLTFIIMIAIYARCVKRRDEDNRTESEEAHDECCRKNPEKYECVMECLQETTLITTLTNRGYSNGSQCLTENSTYPFGDITCQIHVLSSRSVNSTATPCHPWCEDPISNPSNPDCRLLGNVAVMFVMLAVAFGLAAIYFSYKIYCRLGYEGLLACSRCGHGVPCASGRRLTLDKCQECGGTGKNALPLSIPTKV